MRGAPSRSLSRIFHADWVSLYSHLDFKQRVDEVTFRYLPAIQTTQCFGWKYAELQDASSFVSQSSRCHYLEKEKRNRKVGNSKENQTMNPSKPANLKLDKEQSLDSTHRHRTWTDSTLSSKENEEEECRSNEAVCWTPVKDPTVINVLATSSPEIEALCSSPFGNQWRETSIPNLTDQMRRINMGAKAPSLGSPKANFATCAEDPVAEDETIRSLCFESPRKKLKETSPKHRSHRRHNTHIIGCSNTDSCS